VDQVAFAIWCFTVAFGGAASMIAQALA